jgi:nucleotide-binding universal stress UspA family protein
MFTKILVPVEGPSEAGSIFPHAAAIANAYDSQVTLLHLFEPPGGPARQGPVDPWDWQVHQIQAESHLKVLAARLQEAGLEVQTDTLAGKGKAGGADSALSGEIDLVILSAQKPAGFNSWKVNPAVLEIIQRANASVMVVRPGRGAGLEPTDPRYTRIMVPLDGSLRAEYGLNAAVHLARQHGADLLAAHVVKPPEMPRRMPLSQQERSLVQQVIACNKKEASRYLENLSRMLDVSLTPCLSTGLDVAKQLYTVVQQQEVDLVVMNAHGFTGDSHWPYGSLAVNFMLNCPVPVLVVQDFAVERLGSRRAASQEIEIGRRVQNYRSIDSQTSAA